VNKSYELSDSSLFIELLCVCSASNKIPKDFEIFYYDKTTSQKVRYVYSYNAGTSSNPIWVMTVNPSVPVPAVNNLKYYIQDCAYFCVDCGDVRFGIRNDILEKATGNTNSSDNGRLYYEYVDCNGDTKLVWSEGNILIGGCVCIWSKEATPLETLQSGGIFEIYYYRNNEKQVVFAKYSNGTIISRQFWDSFGIDYNSDNPKGNIEYCQSAGLLYNEAPSELSYTPTNEYSPDCLTECDVIFNKREPDGSTTVYKLYGDFLSGRIEMYDDLSIFGFDTQVNETTGDIAHTKNKLWLVGYSSKNWRNIYEFDLTLCPFVARYNRTISIPPNQSFEQSLFAINDTTLLSSYPDGRIVRIDVSGNNPVITELFNVSTYGEEVTDILLTKDNKLYVLRGRGGTYPITKLGSVLILDYTTGLPLSEPIFIEDERQASIETPTGIFQKESEIFVITSLGNVWHITDVSATNVNINIRNINTLGASSVYSQNCLSGITVDECDILVNYFEDANDWFNVRHRVGLYKFQSGEVINLNPFFSVRNSADERFLPQNLTNAPDIAFTTEKIWLIQNNTPFSGTSRVIEYDITLSPFSAVYNRNVIYSNREFNTALTVGRDGLLVVDGRRNVLNIDLNNPNVINQLFEIEPDNYVSGDIIYTPEDRIILSMSNTNVVIYDTIGNRIRTLASLDGPFPGLFMRNGTPYGIGYNGNVVNCETNTIIDRVRDRSLSTPISILGSDSLVKCNSLLEDISPTPTPTPTPTPGLSLTPTPTVTPTPTQTCPPIEVRECGRYKFNVCFSRDITSEIGNGLSNNVEYRLKYPCTAYGDGELYPVDDESINPFVPGGIVIYDDPNDTACPGDDFERWGGINQTRCYLSGLDSSSLELRIMGGRMLVQNVDYYIRPNGFTELSTPKCDDFVVRGNCTPTPTPTPTMTPTPSDDGCDDCEEMIVTLSNESNSATFEYDTCVTKETITVNLTSLNPTKRVCSVKGSFILQEGDVLIEYREDGVLCPSNECEKCCSGYQMTINGKFYIWPKGVWDDEKKTYVPTPITVGIDNNLTATCLSSDCGDVDCYFVLGWYYLDETTPRFLSGWHVSEDRPVKTTDPNKEFNLNVFPGITEILDHGCSDETKLNVNGIPAGTWTVKLLSASGKNHGKSSCGDYSVDCYSGGTGVYTPGICDCLSGLTISANTVTPTPTPTMTMTPTPTPTMTMTPTPTPTMTMTPTPTMTVTPSITTSNTPTPTPGFTGETMTPTPTMTMTPTPTPTMTMTPTPTPSNCPDCYAYDILKLGSEILTFEYTECVEFGPAGGILFDSESNRIVCALEGSVTITSGSGKITKLSFCGCEGILL